MGLVCPGDLGTGSEVPRGGGGGLGSEGRKGPIYALSWLGRHFPLSWARRGGDSCHQHCSPVREASQVVDVLAS